MTKKSAAGPCRVFGDLGDIDGKSAAVRTQPLLGALSFSAEALNGEPELRGMVGNCEMHGLVRYEIAKHKIRGQNEPPIKREISLRGAITPFRPLTHDVGTMRL